MTKTDVRSPLAIVASAAFLAIVVVGAAGIVLSDGEDKPPTAPEASINAGPGRQQVAGCRPTDTDQRIPQTTPTGISWQMLGAKPLPYSATAGPMVVEPSGVARCYAHTPLGALLAATQLTTRYWGAPDWRQVVRRQVMPGPGADAFVKLRSSVTLDVSEPADAQVAGFKFSAYSPQVAVIQMASRINSGALQFVVLTMQWHQGDWKLLLQADGRPGNGATSITTLDGFAPWSPA
ncbi:hypothetical protein ACFY4C_37155 [Actinomadura viridis]|uniref:hypothetical protein n=1 Tax=Actinomadura viridis TaxID=58110 RepID=UPI0036A4338C